jgi:hypothetical protein
MIVRQTDKLFQPNVVQLGPLQSTSVSNPFIVPSTHPALRRLRSPTAISFRIRGTMAFSLSNGTPSTTPVQAHNLGCPVDANGLPTRCCPVDQGGLFEPYTDGFSGGAFESGLAPWRAGSTTVEPGALCPE